MSDLLRVRLLASDGGAVHEGVDTVAITHDGAEFRIGVTRGRLEIWTDGPLLVRPLHGNTIAIERGK
jgi:hypothetical protein